MSENPRIAFVLAMSRNRVIGAKGRLPWRMPSDLKRFKALTMGKPVIMGRKTWESLPRKPLPGRPNIVVTRQAGYDASGATVAASVREALRQARSHCASFVETTITARSSTVDPTSTESASKDLGPSA